QREQRKNNVERRVVREMSPGALPYVDDVAGGEIQNRREIGEVAGPVSPGRNESGKISKRLLAPDIKPAFVRIARRQFYDRKSQRGIKEQPCPYPDHNGTGAGGGSRGNPAQANASDHIEQNQVTEAHYALGLAGICGVRDGLA